MTVAYQITVSVTGAQQKFFLFHLIIVIVQVRDDQVCLEIHK